MQLTIYNNGGGLGFFLEDGEEEKDFVNQEPVLLHGKTLTPGEFTTLDGVFMKPLRYAGVMMDDGSKLMCFHNGDESDLFGSKHHYYQYYWLNENRIGNIFKAGTFRDYHWRKNHWH